MAGLPSRLTKKPRPSMAASSARPVVWVPPFWPMVWVSEPTCTPLAWCPQYTDEKFARLLLKP
jgi:hypothetical protein